MPLPTLGEKNGYFSLGNIKQKIPRLQAQLKEGYHIKNGGLSKPVHAKCWFTSFQVLFLIWLPKLKIYLHVSLARVMSYAQS